MTMNAKEENDFGSRDPLQATDRVDPRVEIVTYLRAHPSACDSLEGIVDWWLPRQRYEMAKAAIQRALDDLVRQGVVEQNALGDGSYLYRLAAQSGVAR